MEQTLKSALASVFSSPRLEAVHLRGLVLESPRQLLSLFSKATAFRAHWSRHERWPESQLWRPKLRSLLVNDFYTGGFSQISVRTLTVATHLRKQIIRATNRGLPGGAEFFSTNLRSIHLFSHSIIEQLGIVFKRCPHDSCLERVILDGPGDVQRIPQAPEFYAAINTARHVRPVGTAVQSVFPSLVRRGMLRITEIEGRGDDVDPDWE
ncbi:hypothetical protein B0H14DRAFT_2729871 [Mycena olivaceomarginata]|nr:hypothetical protein B0H14DRAFT_2729871 [Mycena olivaceomarginata]